MPEATQPQTRTKFDYLDELIRLDESLPELIRVPAPLAREIGYTLVSPGTFIRKMPLSGNCGGLLIHKKHLIDYFLEGSQGPCYCGSGRRYEICDAIEDLPEVVGTILSMNRRGIK